MKNLDPKLLAALISAVVSILVVLLSSLLRSLLEKHFQIFKLESEFIYEQRKKIKEILSVNKIGLLNASDSLNHRLWNFSGNHNEKWHFLKDYNNLERESYFISFIYRLISFFAWQKKLDSEILYLDTTIASRHDLELIKFIKLFQQIMCDVNLFKGYKYNKNSATDHFFNDNFQKMISTMINEGQIYSYEEFISNLQSLSKPLLPLMDFLNGISPDEDRFRWDKLQIVHIYLIVFLNIFGYDYQKTVQKKLKVLIKMYKDNRLLANSKVLVTDYNLHNNKTIKKIFTEFKTFLPKKKYKHGIPTGNVSI